MRMLKNWEFGAVLPLGIGALVFTAGWTGRWNTSANVHAPDSTTWFIRVGVVLMAVGLVGLLSCLVADIVVPRRERGARRKRRREVAARDAATQADTKAWWDKQKEETREIQVTVHAPDHVRELAERVTPNAVIVNGRLAKPLTQAWLFDKAAALASTGLDSNKLQKLSEKNGIDETVKWAALLGDWNIDGLVAPTPGQSTYDSRLDEVRVDVWWLTDMGKQVAKLFRDDPPVGPEFFP